MLTLCFCDRKCQTSGERSHLQTESRLHIAAACTAPSGVSRWKNHSRKQTPKHEREAERWGGGKKKKKTQQVLLCFCFPLNPSEFWRREAVQGQSNMNYITRLSSVEKKPWNPFGCRGSIFCQRNKKNKMFIFYFCFTKPDMTTNSAHKLRPSGTATLRFWNGRSSCHKNIRVAIKAATVERRWCCESSVNWRNNFCRGASSVNARGIYISEAAAGKSARFLLQRQSEHLKNKYCSVDVTRLQLKGATTSASHLVQVVSWYSIQSVSVFVHLKSENKHKWSDIKKKKN